MDTLLYFPGKLIRGVLDGHFVTHSQSPFELLFDISHFFSIDYRRGVLECKLLHLNSLSLLEIQEWLIDENQDIVISLSTNFFIKKNS